MAAVEAIASRIYQDYIACLNKQDWQKLNQFVDDAVCYNDQSIGMSGYRAMLERNLQETPDLYFNIQIIASEPPYIASRLRFDRTPKGRFLGVDVNGKRIPLLKMRSMSSAKEKS